MISYKIINEMVTKSLLYRIWPCINVIVVNPHIVSRFVTDWHCQEGRQGTIHSHAVAKLKNDTGLI